MNTNFVATLISSTPHPEIAPMLMIYEPLIGEWDFTWIGHNDDGTTWRVPGEWHFSWVLEGRAIQDTWICPSRELRNTGKYPTGQYGATLRFFDKEADCVRVVWLGAANPQFKIFNVSFVNNEIIQQEEPQKNKLEVARWIIREITNDSFKWEAYLSKDGGNGWVLTQEVLAKRRN